MECQVLLKTSKHQHFNDLPTSCCFQVPERAIINTESGMRCRFHAPYQVKASWSKENIEEFNNAVLSIIEAAASEDRVCDLRGVVFPGPISFANLSGLSCLPHICLYGTEFRGDTDFGSINFNRDVSFEWAEFFGEAKFEKVSFLAVSDFRRIKFLGKVNFRETKFKLQASFCATSFYNDTDFWKATFGRGGNFSLANFRAQAQFTCADFQDSSDFWASDFLGDASFTDSIFRDRVSFHGIPKQNFLSQEPDAYLTPRAFCRDVDFSGAQFLGGLHCRDRRFLGKTRFNNTLFMFPPEFHGSEFQPDTNFDSAAFYGRESSSAPGAFRVLKLMMGDVRNRDGEAKFFALEEQSLRKQSSTGRLEKLLSWFYEQPLDMASILSGPYLCF